MICNPNNPTGTYVPIGELEAFADTLPEDVLLVMDEAGQVATVDFTLQ